MGRFGSVFGSVWVGFRPKFFFFDNYFLGQKKKKFFFFSGLRLGPGAPKNAKKRQNFDVLTIWGYTICTATGAHNLDFSLANSFTKIFFFDFGKGKSQAKKIHP